MSSGDDNEDSVSDSNSNPAVLASDRLSLYHLQNKHERQQQQKWELKSQSLELSKNKNSYTAAPPTMPHTLCFSPKTNNKLSAKAGYHLLMTGYHHSATGEGGSVDLNSNLPMATATMTPTPTSLSDAAFRWNSMTQKKKSLPLVL